MKFCRCFDLFQNSFCCSLSVEKLISLQVDAFLDLDDLPLKGLGFKQ